MENRASSVQLIDAEVISESGIAVMNEDAAEHGRLIVEDETERHLINHIFPPVSVIGTMKIGHMENSSIGVARRSD